MIEQPNRTPLIDEARMQNLQESLADGLCDVIESFLDDVPKQIMEMRLAYQQGAWVDLQRIAHSMKSSSGIFGAQALVDLCRDIEAEARLESPAVEGLIQEFENGFKEVQPVLKTYLSGQQFH
jgi:HPt (histidine-containing phosphotransfer) domain-containing protein